MNQPSVSMETSLQPVPTRAADQKFCHACSQLLHCSAASCPRCGAAQASTPGWGRTGADGFAVAGAPGNALAAHHVFCRGCGRPIHETAISCPSCGAVQRGAGAGPYAGPSRNVAAILAIFLGGIGAHKFYLGKFFQGLLYLLLFWSFIPAIVGFIEGIYYLTLSEQEFATRYA